MSDFVDYSFCDLGLNFLIYEMGDSKSTYFIELLEWLNEMAHLRCWESPKAEIVWTIKIRISGDPPQSFKINYCL